MLLLVIGIFFLPCILVFLGVTYLESSKADYPSGIANPKELRRIHTISTGLEILGKTLERFGICSEIALFRFMIQLGIRKPEKDAELSIKELNFDGVPVRLYQPSLPYSGDYKGVVFFHGGGFVLGSIESYDSFCRYMSKKSGAVVVSVGYRLAPEHRYPAAFDDCLNATIYFLKTAKHYGVNPSSIIICGDSAGGSLAAGVSQVLVTRTDIPKPLAQVLIYPSLQMINCILPSHQQNGMVPLLLHKRSNFFRLTYLGGGMSMSEEVFRDVYVPPELRKKLSKWLDASNLPDRFKVRGYNPKELSYFSNEMYQRFKHSFDATCSPILAEDSVISLLPKTYFLTCEFDILRDEGILYKKRLEDNGIPVTWYHVIDGFHGIVSFFDQPAFESSKQAMDNVINFLKDA